MCFLSNKMPQKFLAGGALPRTHWGAYSAPPDLYLMGRWARCPLSKNPTPALSAAGLWFQPDPHFFFDKSSTGYTCNRKLRKCIQFWIFSHIICCMCRCQPNTFSSLFCQTLFCNNYLQVKSTNFSSTVDLQLLLDSLYRTFKEFKSHEQIENKLIMRKLRSKMRKCEAICSCHEVT